MSLAAYIDLNLDDEEDVQERIEDNEDEEEE